MLNKKCPYILIFLCVISFSACADSNPEKMFAKLKANFTNPTSQDIDSLLSDGMSLTSYSPVSKGSDRMYVLEIFSSLGKTVYQCYIKTDENVWYVMKEAVFYQHPYEPEGADIEKTFFRYNLILPYAFDFTTNQYSIQQDTDMYPAVVDMRSIKSVIEVIIKNLKDAP